jgi:Mor family transcriptional regulator
MQRIVKELVSAVGLPDAIVIIRRWGGREFYIPTTVRHHDALALTLGLQAATLLVKAFGGRSLQLPAERNTLIDLRNELIVRRLTENNSHESIGLEFGLSRQMINVIAKRARERGTFAGVNAAGPATESTLVDLEQESPLCPGPSFASPN